MATARAPASASAPVPHPYFGGLIPLSVAQKRFGFTRREFPKMLWHRQLPADGGGRADDADRRDVQ